MSGHDPTLEQEDYDLAWHTWIHIEMAMLRGMAEMVATKDAEDQVDEADGIIASFDEITAGLHVLGVALYHSQHGKVPTQEELAVYITPDGKWN